MRNTSWRLALFIALVFATVRSSSAADIQLYAPKDFDDVRSEMLEWVAQRGTTDRELLDAVGTLWADPEGPIAGEDIVDRIARTMSLIDPEVRRLMNRARLVDGPLIAPRIEPLLETDSSSFFNLELRVYYGRYLARRRMFDEALEVLEPVDPAMVADPATCLFFRAVCEHQLLMKDQALMTLKQLTQDTERVPVAYSTVAVLMQDELKNLKSQSLDEITRMMSDVERRLGLGRGGQETQKREQEVIAALDEMIKKIEQSQGGGGGTGGSGNQSNGPASDSSVAGSTAPGKVDDKDVGNDGGWGDLPAKEQARAKQDIARKFPPQYIEAINRYNRKLATRRANSGR